MRAWSGKILKISIILSIAVSPWAMGQEDTSLSFNRDIRPILSDNCFACHGPDESKRKAGLRLDIAEGVFGELASGNQAVVPGKPEASSIIHRITTSDVDDRMPPADSNKSLSADQIALLTRWVTDDAPWEEHWAFEAPKRPRVPRVYGDETIQNPIDNFVRARLQKEGLRASPPAERAVLLRRLSLDLTGLPPTPEEVDAFVLDASVDAYEKQVDRLLASPHYGERWARHWLDLARYADTNGYEKDRPRKMWMYRDWVIDAFNRNMPYDQFSIEQLAGDLLPDPTEQQLIATGFHRNTMLNDEGGIDPEEFRMVAVIDRVNTTAEVWLGLTMACAQCHTHKYDPISHSEYYQFLAYFNSTQDNGLSPDPRLFKPTPEQQKTLDTLMGEIKELESELEESGNKLEVEQKRWELSLLTPSAKEKRDALPENIRSIIDTPLGDRRSESKNELRNYFREQDEKWKHAKEKLQSRREEIGAVDQDTALIMRELATPRETNVLIRGNIFSKGEPVSHGTPAILHELPPDAPANRLGLANWLMDKQNPLTARVFVNRIWASYFGQGLVSTVNDFGTQGIPPTHPELLDWLATEFMRTDWDIKALHKLIVTSASYRQSSVVRPELLEKDPDNALYARGPRLRLEAEYVRDAALAAAGLLSPEIGGKSVFPPQPPGIWEISFSAHDLIDSWKNSEGDARYRRGMYTFWKRTAPYPSHIMFDAPRGEVCISLRSQTNTPLQALVTMNDPVFIEAAGGLAKRMLVEATGELDTRLVHAFRLCLARRPRTEEIASLRKVFNDARSFYAKHPEEAAALFSQARLEENMASPAHQAAYIIVANTLLNLDEMITKG